MSIFRIRGIDVRLWEDRFWSKVDRSGGPDACWLWMGCKGYRGHGMFAIRASSGPEGCYTVYAHRVAYELTYRINIENPMCVLHNHPDVRCPSCCNPKHLYVGTRASNLRDQYKFGERPRDNGFSGEKAPSAKLTEAMVREDRADWLAGKCNIKDIADRRGLSHPGASAMLNGKSWDHIDPELIQNRRRKREKLTKEQVAYAVSQRGEKSQSALARELGVSQMNIWAIQTGYRRSSDSGVPRQLEQTETFHEGSD